MRNRLSRRPPERVLATRIVVLACSVSAGVHAALVPAHLREEPRLGAAFVVTVVLLAAIVVALSTRPRDPWIARAAAVLLAGLMAAYAATRSTGIPWLAPDPEQLDGVGLATNVVEGLGLVFALWLSQRGLRGPRSYTLTEVFR